MLHQFLSFKCKFIWFYGIIGIFQLLRIVLNNFGWLKGVLCVWMGKKNDLNKKKTDLNQINLIFFFNLKKKIKELKKSPTVLILVQRVLSNCLILNFFHLLVALLQDAHFPKGFIKQKSFLYEMRATFCIKSCWRDLI